MSMMKQKIATKAKKFSRNVENGEIGSGYHSRAYHRFFEGYTEYHQERMDGKRPKIVRIYSAEYYRQLLSPKARWRLRICYLGLYLLSIIIFGMAAFPSHSENMLWYVALPQALSSFLFFLMLRTIFRYVTSKENMTIYEYKTSSEAFKKELLVGIFFFFLCAAMMVIAMAIHSDLFSIGKILSTLAYFVCAGIFRLMWKLEENLEYEKVENKNEVSSDAAYID